MIRFCQNLLTASIHGSVVILAVMLPAAAAEKNAPQVHLLPLDAGRHPAADAHFRPKCL